MAKMMLLVPYAKYYVHFQGDWLRSLVRDGHEVVAVSPDGMRDTVRDGVLYRRAPIRNTGMNPLYDLYSLYRLAVLLRRERPDILCCYSLKPNLYGSLAAAAVGVRRVYLFVTGLGYVFAASSPPARLLRYPVSWLYGAAIRLCSKVFFENKDDAALFERLGMPLADKAMLLNGMGVNIRRFRPWRSPSSPVVFLLVARLLADKGIGEYVQAARIVKRCYPHAVFQLLGPFDRNPSAIPRSRVEAWEAAGDVQYLGETDDVRPYLGAATVFVLPSYREGTPKSVLEAMAMGLPVITTDAPGCREPVVHGVNGLLVPVKDAVALAEAMMRFLRDDGLAAAMGAASRRIAVSKYDVDSINQTIKLTMGIAGAGTSATAQQQAGGG